MSRPKTIRSVCCKAHVWWTSYNPELVKDPPPDHWICQKCRKKCFAVDQNGQVVDDNLL